MQQIFLTYMNQSECPSYTLTGTVNDQFYDIDASKKYFNIPVDNGSNTIDLKVNFLSQNNQFQSIPIGFSFQTKKMSTLHFFQNLPDPHFFIKHGFEWLGTKSNINVQFHLHLERNKNRRWQMHFNHEYFADDLDILQYPAFDYTPNSWLVCYSPFNYDLHRISPLSIRIEKNFYVSPISNQNRFNYITIGNKSVSLKKVQFYRKINSVFDYLNCLKIANLIQTSSYY